MHVKDGEWYWSNKAAGSYGFKKENEYVKSRVKTTPVRRYKETPTGGIEIVYSELVTNSDNISGYNYLRGDKDAPVGTTYEYLDDKKTWGYTEPLPKSRATLLYNNDMREKVLEILKLNDNIY